MEDVLLWLAHPESHIHPLRTSFCISQDSLEEQNFHGMNIYYEGDVLDACIVGAG